MKLIHEQAVELWLIVKSMDKNENPSIYIFMELLNRPYIKDVLPKNIVELCQEINNEKGFGELSEDEKTEIKAFAIKLFEKKKKMKEDNSSSSQRWVSRLANFGQVFHIITTISVILGIISLFVGGFSWWIIGLFWGNWEASGALNVAAVRLREEERPYWELPVHILIVLAVSVALIYVSIKNF